MRRKLSTIEQVLDGNVVYFVRLDGTLSLDRLRSALSRVQGKHPALRALIREERDGLYYEENKAPEIPLRVVSRVSEDDYRRECQTELHTVFAYDQPQLRLVWLKSERESDLLLTTSHRICDGMSIFILVKEVLRSLHSDEELVPYETPTLQDMIGGHQPAKPWAFKLKLFLMNVILGLIPSSRRTPENKEHHLEWKSDAALLAALKRRCKAEGVSVHAALAVTLERSLFAVLGKDKSPKWIDNPMDIRRGHFPALKNDTVFFAGGSFKLRIAAAQDVEFWARARAVYEQIREEIEQEMQDIPGRFYLWERLRSVTGRQIQTIVRMGDALKLNGSWNLFALSNLGNIVIDDRDSPFRVKDIRIYMHSFTFRTLCLVTYTLHGEMRFYCVADDKCLTHEQAAMLKQELMNLLQLQVAQREGPEAEISNVLTAAAKSFFSQVQFLSVVGHSCSNGDERQIVKRKLFAIEEIAEMNIACLVRLEGGFSLNQLRSALARVQGKHPVLRALIRKEEHGLYYEQNSALEIPLRIVARYSEEHSWQVCQTELTTVLAEDKPQLRVVWLQSEWESDLLLTTSHRICDLMSMFTIVQEVLRSLYSDEELIPYAPITTQDIIGGYQPLQPWKSKLTARLVNALLRLIPHSRHEPDNKEYHLEWKAERPFFTALKQRCKVEAVSVHAVLTVTLERALFAALGRERAPKWIINPIDLRRGRFAALTGDMLFYGGGNFKISTSTAPDMEFWARVRAVHAEIRKEIDREIRDIPGRFHLIELVHPPTSGQIQSIVRLGDALKCNNRWSRFGLSHLGNGSWNRFGLSNLGNIVIDDSNAPFRVKDLRLYMHSFNIRALGLIPYTLNEEMRFYLVSDEKCLRPDQVDALKREFMLLLEEQVARPADGSGITPDTQCSAICQMTTADGTAMNGSASVLVTGDEP